ncbi:MAG TPA: ribosome biogenesis GTPase Der [Candidatus Acidoferrales bacterium]|nr:ribosome biogenesis GTPase Der [Candidatus Acidoferrales bacterium]
MTSSLLSVVIAGRPNVGKSTLFNRLTGTRRSIVTDEPGITRDRIYGTATWENRTFEVVDTGGIVPEDKALIPREILRQARVAIDSAALLVMVADGRVGLTPLDEELARLLRRSGKPLIVAVNKVDSLQQESLTASFHELGVPVFGISSEHGTGIDDLLDYIVAQLFPSTGSRQGLPAGRHGTPARRGGDLSVPNESPADGALAPGVSTPDPYASVNIAIIGRPNVGKSTLLNQLAGEERSIVSPEAGTTRDSIDTVVKREGKTYEFIDTAGIRRKGKTNLVAEKLAVVMARKSLERADIALLIVDSSQGVTAGDATIAGYAAESGCSVIIVMNKFDLALEAARKTAAEWKAQRDAKVAVGADRARAMSRRERSSQGKSASSRAASKREPERDRQLRALTDPGLLMADYEKIAREKFKFLSFAPIVFLSALTAARVQKLYPLIDRVAAARRRRISTGEINRWLKTVDLDRGTSPNARRIKIYYMTQASSAPPTFVVFTNQPARLHFSYERFLENRMRESFDFTGAPVRFLQRTKDRRRSGGS